MYFIVVILLGDKPGYVSDLININISLSEELICMSELKKQNSDIMPKRRFCKECLILQPYRTKHCKICNMCVAKYDHHCPWIGGCVGEKNIGMFILMILSMTITYILTLVAVN